MWVESLEQRQLLSVVYDAATDTLSLNGTAGNDQYSVVQKVGPTGMPVIEVMEGLAVYTFTNAFQPITFISASLKDGNDVLTLQSTLNIKLNASGGAGHDRIEGGAADDRIDGGDGNDTLTGNDGNDTITGGNDNDIITGGAGDDYLSGGAGADYIHGNEGKDSIFGYSGNDTLFGDEQADFISGGDDSDDLIYGGPAADVLLGGEGNDTINGEDGNDTISGEDGRDSLIGDLGDDLIYGGDQGDAILGGNGNDTLEGDAGNDVIEGDEMDDRIIGDDGNDTLSGNDGNDEIFGGTGNDSIDGGDNADRLHGDEGNDTILGGGGADNLWSGSGADRLEGGAGQDTLVSIDNDSNDTLLGQGGFDSFWYDKQTVGPNTTDSAADADVNELETNVHEVDSFVNGADKTLDGDSIGDPAGGLNSDSYADHPLFGSAGPQVTDIEQGALADCWLLSSLAAGLNADANVIHQLVADLGDGTYVVQMNNDMYRIDADLYHRPNDIDNLRYANFGADGSLWVALVEKAWAISRGNDYDNLNNDSPWGPLGKIGGTDRNAWVMVNNAAAQTVLDGVADQMSRGYGVVACSQNDDSKVDILAANHCYAIMSFTFTLDGHVDSVTLYNPWGTDGGDFDDGSNDGFVTLTVDQYADNVQHLYGTVSADFSDFA